MSEPSEAEDPQRAGSDAAVPPEHEDGADGGREEAPPSHTDVLNERGPRGAIQDRIGTERDALSGYGRAGQYVGRDQHNHYYGAPGGQRGRVAPLRPRDVQEVEQAFVEPADFDELCRRARGRRIVILQGDRGSGRFAAARRLLCVLGGETPALHGVDPAIGLDELTAEDLAEGAGYVYRDPLRPGAITAFGLDHAAALLEAAGAHLVITVDAARPLADARAADLVLRPGRVRDRREITRGLLALELGAAKARILLDEPGVRELLDEQLAQDGPPRHARTVADELAHAYRQALPLARTAGQALRLRDDERRAEWFESLEDLSVQCMAVSTAVLSGEPYETVALAAMKLKGDLEPAAPHRDSLRPLNARLAPTKRKWLNSLGAHTVPSTVRLRYGATAPTEVIRYLDPSAQGKVLGYFWREFDEQRPLLLAWLRWCAEHPLESVRTRTAVATGFLAARGFDLVRALVIEPVARRRDRQARTVAAAALHATVRQHPALREPVRELLRGWSAPGQPVQLRATAARAWRVEYERGPGDAPGEGGVSAALDRLGEHAADDALAVTAAVCESVTELWETEWDGGQVPAGLLAWTRGDAGTCATVARLAFLTAAGQLVRRLPGDDFDWPGLLHIASMDAARMHEIAALWRTVLNDAVVHESAREIFGEWAAAADRVPLVRRSLARLAQAVATDETTAGRLRYAARGWADGIAPASSADVLNALNRR
ncbi:hypothetical protein E1200_31135 [Actinomadura sp. GC306]|uniref:hypothetical protein n=1 Tax=Actinomadura sp. GC306 TaxID=2530367 RepID=UPI001042A6E4|nr:hypothetical protein [Actinomadura sp. GC306]TDC60063.1 hypothetical protein E1200_31135 [Actinomadura sp. GC306]